MFEVSFSFIEFIIFGIIYFIFDEPFESLVLDHFIYYIGHCWMGFYLASESGSIDIGANSIVDGLGFLTLVKIGYVGGNIQDETDLRDEHWNGSIGLNFIQSLLLFSEGSILVAEETLRNEAVAEEVMN